MNTYRKYVWLPILIGAVLTLCGVASVIWPGIIVNVLPIALGILSLLYGGIQIAMAVIWSDIMPVPQRIVGGIAALIIGVMFIVNRTVSIAFIGVLIGMLAVVSAFASAYYAFKNRDYSGEFWYSVVNSVIKAVIGIIMLINPFNSMAAITVLIGIYTICTGVSIIIGTLCCKDTFNVWW